MAWVRRKIEEHLEEAILTKAREAGIPAETLNQFLKHLHEHWDSYFNRGDGVSADEHHAALKRISELEEYNKALKQKLEETEKALERLRENSERLLAEQEKTKRELEKLRIQQEENEKDRQLKKQLKIADYIIAKEKEKFKLLREQARQNPRLIDLEKLTAELLDDGRAIKLITGKVEELPSGENGKE